jgi:hypothetical protein
LTIAFVQHLVAREDLDGRPRRLWIGYDAAGTAIEAYDAPEGKPLAYRGAPALLSHNIPASDYGNLRSMFERRGTLHVETP